MNENVDKIEFLNIKNIVEIVIKIKKESSTKYIHKCKGNTIK